MGDKGLNLAKAFRTGSRSQSDQHLQCERPAPAPKQNEVVRAGVGHLAPLCTKAAPCTLSPGSALRAGNFFHDQLPWAVLSGSLLLTPPPPGLLPTFRTSKRTQPSPQKKSSTQIPPATLPDTWYQVWCDCMPLGKRSF